MALGCQFSASQVLSDVNCAGRLSTLRRSLDFAALSGIIDRGFEARSPFGPRAANDFDSIQFRRVIEHGQHLTSEERVILLDKFNRRLPTAKRLWQSTVSALGSLTPPTWSMTNRTRNDLIASQSLEMIVGLILHSQPYWERFFENIVAFASGSSGHRSRYYIADDLMDTFLALPFREELLYKMAELRPRINGDRYQSAKRILDHFFNHAVRADLIIKQAIENGDAPLVAYRRYFEVIRRYYKEGPTADQVFAVVKMAQRDFMDCPELNALSAPGETGHDLYSGKGRWLEIGGSFITGAGKKDIDLHPHVYEFKTDHLAAYFASTTGLEKTKFDVQNGFTPGRFMYLHLQQVQFVVRPEGIYLEISAPYTHKEVYTDFAYVGGGGRTESFFIGEI